MPIRTSARSLCGSVEFNLTNWRSISTAARTAELGSGNSAIAESPIVLSLCRHVVVRRSWPVRRGGVSSPVLPYPHCAQEAVDCSSEGSREIDEKLRKHKIHCDPFTDVAGSTSFFERNGDTAGLAMIHRHDELARTRTTTCRQSD